MGTVMSHPREDGETRRWEKGKVGSGTTLDQDSLAKDYRSGTTLREVGKRHGVSHEAARYHILRSGTPMRKGGIRAK